MPVSVLRSVLTEREYLQWISYFTFKQPDSLEIQMAVLTNLVASGLGVKGKSPEDFIINKHKMQPTDKKGKKPEEVETFNGIELVQSEQIAASFGMFATKLE